MEIKGVCHSHKKKKKKKKKQKVSDLKRNQFAT